MTTNAESDWVAKIADRAIRRHQADIATGAKNPQSKLIVASGLSPSGPIHLGNLREVLLPHFVAEEVKARGVACEHILSWDDYDRLRKVPAGVDAGFAQYIGQPLTSVPDPHGGLSSWAERFKAPLRQALTALGVDLREISQTEMYGSGSYRQQILTALKNRKAIDELLGRYRTLPGTDADPSRGEGVDAEPQEEGGIGDNYWPYIVYCHDCGRDTTEIISVSEIGDLGDSETGYQGPVEVCYQCHQCHHQGCFDLTTENRGKLVWKVDWPMRWAFEGVTFEGGGDDHSTPGSSFTVGSELVSTVFGGSAPEYAAYSFVGTRGVGKLSSSAGAVPTPKDALEVLEVPILRWMYVRKSPRQSITIELSSGIQALYDEWDALSRKVEAGQSGGSQRQAYERAQATASTGPFPRPGQVVPFRTLVSAVAVGAGDDNQIARIVSEIGGVAPEQVADTEPRLSLARNWINDFAPDQDRIQVRSEPDHFRLGRLTAKETAWLDQLGAHLEDDWSLEGARTLVYGVPKLVAGLPADTDPTPELKAEQREFFKLLYSLFLGTETGPRLPTLLMALGADKVRVLLGQRESDLGTSR